MNNIESLVKFLYYKEFLTIFKHFCLTLLKARFVNIEEWQSIINAISTIAEDAIFICNSEGVIFRGMDESKKVLLDVLFPKSSFKELTSKNTHFSLKIKDFKTILNLASGGDEILIHVPTKTKMKVSITGPLSTECEIKLIQRKKTSLSLPDIKYKSKLIVESDTLTRIVYNIHQISKFIKIQCDSNSVIFSGGGELGKAKINLDKTSTNLKKITSKGKSSAIYEIEHMAKIIREVGKSSKNIKLDYADRNPVRIMFDLPSQIRVNYYIAPELKKQM